MIATFLAEAFAEGANTLSESRSSSWMPILTAALPLAGVALGSWLTTRSNRSQREFDVRIRLHDTKVEAYAVWMQTVTDNFYSVLSLEPARANDEERRHAAGLAHRRILLLEQDAELRRLLDEVYGLYPEDGPTHAKIQEAIKESGEYEPFDSKMKIIAQMVRESRPST